MVEDSYLINQLSIFVINCVDNGCGTSHIFVLCRSGGAVSKMSVK